MIVEQLIDTLIQKISTVLPKKATNNVPTILQIVPAQNEKWAKFEMEEGDYSYVKVDLWALCQTEDGERLVYGMCAEDYMDFAEHISNFVCYVTKEEMEKESE